MSKVIDGYMCRTNCDVILAKKGIDPAHPHDLPGTVRKAGSAEPSAPSTSSAPAQAVGENKPATSGTLGTVLSTFL